MIPYDELKPDDKIKNLQLAMDAAEKYFGLEKYLTPEDIFKLDENSMVVYISEYYYGIAEQMKVDLAARRIAKLIKLTEENDALKAEFNKTGQKFLDHLKKVEGVLEDRTCEFVPRLYLNPFLGSITLWLELRNAWKTSTSTKQRTRM